MRIRQFQASPGQSSLVVAAALVVATLAACGDVTTTPGGVTTTPGGATTLSGPQLEREQKQARDELQRWADAVAAAGG